MINPMDLTGKKVLVTGASSGIGRECAILLSKLGAELVLVARNEEKLKETMSMLEGSNHTYLSYDISNIELIKEMMEKACTNKKLNGFVHSAGVAPIIPIQAMDYKKMAESMSVNYFSFLEIVKYYVKRKFSEGGSIVAISSVSSKIGWKGATLYCGTKGALDSSVRALAIELYDKGIRVNSVMPSNIKTKMLNDIMQYASKSEMEVIAAKQPLGLGEPRDVANAVAFLLSNASRFITGTTLVVDGGYLAQ